MDRSKLFRHGLFGGAALLAFLGVALAAAVAPEGKRGSGSLELSGKIVTQSRNVQDFDEIVLHGSYEFELTAGEEYAVKLTGDQALLERVRTRVTDGRLEIGPKGDTARNDLKDLQLSVKLPALATFTVNGAADADLKQIDSDTLTLIINGAGRIVAAGRCGRLSVTTNGAGDVNARELRCEEAAVAINGAGDTTVYAAKRVTTTIAGVGDIVVYGDPQSVQRSEAGFGSVKIRGEPPAGE